MLVSQLHVDTFLKIQKIHKNLYPKIIKEDNGDFPPFFENIVDKSLSPKESNMLFALIIFHNNECAEEEIITLYEKYVKFVKHIFSEHYVKFLFNDFQKIRNIQKTHFFLHPISNITMKNLD